MSYVESKRAFQPPNTVSDQAARLFDENSKDRKWMNPISMSTLKRAVQRKQSKCVLNGIEYTIEYTTWRSKLVPPYQCVKLRRVDGANAPFGYVSVKKILEFEFEDDEK